MVSNKLGSSSLHEVWDTVPLNKIIERAGLSLAPYKEGYVDLFSSEFYPSVEAAVNFRKEEALEFRKSKEFKEARRRAKKGRPKSPDRLQKTVQVLIKLDTRGLVYRDLMRAVDLTSSISGRCLCRKGMIRVPLEFKDEVVDSLEAEGFRIAKVSEEYGY